MPLIAPYQIPVLVGLWILYGIEIGIAGISKLDFPMLFLQKLYVNLVNWKTIKFKRSFFIFEM